MGVKLYFGERCPEEEEELNSGEKCQLLLKWPKQGIKVKQMAIEARVPDS